MDTDYGTSNILFIKGVFIKDCIPLGDIFEQQIMDQLTIETPIVEHKLLPANFVGLDKWVKSNTLKCWYCDLQFETIPIFIPNLIEPSNNTNKYNIGVEGCFCSFCCSMSYNNLYNPKICRNIKVKEMIIFLYKIFNNRTIKEILPSPSKYVMKHYGGPLEIAEYREKIHALEKIMHGLSTL